MKRAAWSFLCLIALPPLFAADATAPKELATGLKNPESIVIAPNGKTYVSVIGEFNKDGDGSVVILEDGKTTPFVTGLDDPKGIIAFQQWLFLTDKTKVLKIDTKGTGKAEVLADGKAFPIVPTFLNDIEVDIENGALYVSDSGDDKGKDSAVYRIDPKTKKVTLVTDAKKIPTLQRANGLAMDGQNHILVLDAAGTGDLYRVKIADGTGTKLADGFEGGDGLAWDKYGRLFITSWKTGKVWGIPRPGEKPVLIPAKQGCSADLCVDSARKLLLIPDMRGGTVNAVSSSIPGWEVDESPLALEPSVAFPDLELTGWQPVNDAGKPVPLRPIALTHANDGSNRVFLATQHGVIHHFPNDQKVKKSSIFIDLQDRVVYNDNQNEEGFLGLAFHPKFKQNGEFFVFYTPKKEKLVNVVSRFRVSKDDPNKADPNSEEVLLRYTKPFWNHDGGTIAFGPDGYLYIVHGDGGSANDPMNNAQNLKTMLGKVLRIDVDKKENGKPYAIPKDNPFVDRKDALPEIWAYGLRNPWRIAFDRKTGQLWAGEVGQNLYEEISLINKGGNYGWKLRESLHPFSVNGVGPREDLIEPIWEYHHDVGKSITGGGVYRGKRVPELEGHYLYADYVSGRAWALKYDADKKRVVANRPLKDKSHPVLSFGEDQDGEMYYLIASPTGKGIYWYGPAAK